MAACILNAADFIDKLIDTSRLLCRGPCVILNAVRAARLELELEHARLTHLVLKEAQALRYLIRGCLEAK